MSAPFPDTRQRRQATFREVDVTRAARAATAGGGRSRGLGTVRLNSPVELAANLRLSVIQRFNVLCDRSQIRI